MSFDEASSEDGSCNGSMSRRVEEKRQELFDRMTYVSQYHVEGGGYNTETSVFKKPTDVLDDVIKDVIEAADEIAVIDTLSKIYDTANEQPRTDDELQLLGSQPVDVNSTNFKDAQRIEAQDIDSTYATLQAGSVVKPSVEHDKRLKDLINKTLVHVKGPIDLYIADKEDSETIAQIKMNHQQADIYLINQIYKDQMQPTATFLTHGLRMSAGEAFTHELIHHVSYYGIENKPLARKQVRRLWEQARSVLTYRDLMPNISNTDPLYEETVKQAKIRYNYIFNPKHKNHLHEFAALGTTNEGVIKALSKVKTNRRTRALTKEANELTLLDKLLDFVEGVMNFIQNKFYNTSGKTADVALNNLISSIASVDSAAKYTIINQIGKGMNVLTKKGNAINKFVRDYINDNIVNSDFVKNNKFKAVKFTGQMLDLAHKGKVTEYVDFVAKEVLKPNRMATGMASVMSELLEEAKGRTKLNGVFHDIKRIGSMNIDQLRKRTAEGIAGMLREQFNDYSDEVQTTASDAITTDFSALSENLGYDNSIKLLENGKNISTAISMLEDRIQKSNPKYGKFYTNHARNLGYFMLTNNSLLPTGALKNAHNIARLFGTGQVLTGNLTKVTRDIDTLASLYSLEYLGTSRRRALYNLFKSEPNGMSHVVAMQTAHKKESAKVVDPVHMTKGYMSEILDNEIDFKVATLKDAEDLIKLGYRMTNKLTKDINDPNKTEFYGFVAKNGGQGTYTSGLINLMSFKSKGTSQYNMRTAAGDNSPVFNAKQDLVIMSAAKQKEFLKTMGNVYFKSGNYTSAVFNPDGVVTGWNYLMSEANKREMLQKDSRIGQILPKMIADTTVQPNIKENNRTVVKAFYDQYKEQYKNNPRIYVEVSPTAKDKFAREAWSRMPKDMQMEVRKVWGSNKMLIPRNMVRLAFGEKDFSIADFIQENRESESAWKSTVASMLGALFGDKLAKQLVRARTAEAFLQELVGAVKDIWVIKSAMVTLGNTVSNTMLLWMNGLGFVEICKGYVTAWTAARKYKREIQEMTKLQNEMAYDKGLSKRAKAMKLDRIRVLQSELNSNAARELIEGGALQTIVEDVVVAEDSDDTLIRSNLKRFTAKVSNKLPTPVRKAIAFGLFMQGTEVL